ASKDVFSYVLRAKNAECNKDIPEDKKRFVVAMDKATGITTALSQLAVGAFISSDKFQNIASKKLFPDLFKKPEQMKIARASFNSLSTLIGAALITKRVIVPLLSVPLANVLMCKNKKNEKQEETPLCEKYFTKKSYNSSLSATAFLAKSPVKRKVFKQFV
ncbi:hypothetical protein tpqmel_1079, partial [Candidatus Gastranaerophilus sp. (ex Termes propinquus)]